MGAVIQTGLVFGAAFSIFMSAMNVNTLWLNPTIWAERAPEDIRQAVGPVDDRTRKQRRLFAGLTLLVMLGVFVLSIIQLKRVLGILSFWQVFLDIFMIITLWNLVDLLLIDWLLLSVIQPGFIFMPGTEGLKAYQDLGYHFRGFLRGLAGSIIGGLLIAGIYSLVDWVLK